MITVPSRKRALQLVFVLLAVPVAWVGPLGGSLVHAQDTGGSFGGGDWGGGGSDWGGGGSDWGGGGGSDWGSSDTSWGSGSDWGSDGYDSSYSGGGGGGGGAVGAIVVVVIISVIVLFAASAASASRRRRAVGGYGVPRPPALPVDVSAISIAIDWRARKRLQERLAELARTGDTRTTAGLTALLHETVVEIRRVEHAWLYAGAVNADPGPPSAAQAKFSTVAQDMRSRFRHELIRSAAGSVRTAEAPALRARASEGDGVVVVTVLVAARGNIPDVAHAQDAGHLRMLMRSLGALNASQLVALEVIWSPAAENDRMSTAELEVLYPELEKIAERSIAGRVFCRYCSYPYPAELLECPECGAPGIRPPEPAGSASPGSAV